MTVKELKEHLETIDEDGSIYLIGNTLAFTRTWYLPLDDFSGYQSPQFLKDLCIKQEESK